MKKIDLGQMVGILANLGVLVGILLLVYELNQNRQMMRSQTRNAISETLVDISYQQATNPQLAAILAKVRAGDPLTAEEQIQYGSMQTAEWRYRENVSYQYRSSLYDEDEYLAQRATWKRLLNSDRGMRTYWCSRSPGTLAAEFDAEVSDLLDQPCE